VTPEAALERLRPLIHERGLATEWPRVERVLRAAHRAHDGQKRKDGTPYVTHPLRVAEVVLRDWRVADADLACAALLHDAVEDTPLTLAQVEELAGPAVRELVYFLTKEDPKGYPSKDDRDRVYFERLRGAPVGAAIVKCADRVDNLRDMKDARWSLEKQRGYLVEARELILPLAEGKHPAAARGLADTIAAVERALPRS
jgi:GTP pyrophosphokinase